MKKILLAILMLSALSMFSCKQNSGGDPKAVLGQFFDDLSKNDIDGARKLATKDSKQMIDMMEMGLKMGKDKKDTDKFSKENMEIGDAKIDGDKAVVPVKEKTSGESLNYTMKKEDGSWKVAFDKASVMSMGMEKMQEKGMNPGDSLNKAMEELQKVNIDSIKDKLKEGMEKLDTAKKELEKIK